MDYKFKDKLKNNTISIAIMYKGNQYQDAKRLKVMMENRYANGIKSYQVQAKLVKYKNIKTAEANIYYLLPTKSKEIKAVVKKAATNHALTFAYNRDDLKHGVMISLNVSKKIKPLLNLKAIKIRKIALRPVLIDISTIYIHNEEGSSIDHSNIRGFNFSRVNQA